MLAIEKAAKECGATASVVLLQSLDNPVTPFFMSKRLALTVAHVGYVQKKCVITAISHRLTYRDTRVLLTSVDSGRVLPMTENHHPDTRIEAHRLRRTMGGGLILDSFGEARCDLLQLFHVRHHSSLIYCHRWMGALENTRRSKFLPDIFLLVAELPTTVLVI